MSLSLDKSMQPRKGKVLKKWGWVTTDLFFPTSSSYDSKKRTRKRNNNFTFTKTNHQTTCVQVQRWCNMISSLEWVAFLTLDLFDATIFWEAFFQWSFTWWPTIVFMNWMDTIKNQPSACAVDWLNVWLFNLCPRFLWHWRLWRRVILGVVLVWIRLRGTVHLFTREKSSQTNFFEVGTYASRLVSRVECPWCQKCHKKNWRVICSEIRAPN